MTTKERAESRKDNKICDDKILIPAGVNPFEKRGGNDIGVRIQLPYSFPFSFAPPLAVIPAEAGIHASWF
jgi:hypothetical protein